MDLHNRLTAVKLYNAPDKGTCADVSYTYDALNYRIERMGSDGTTVYAYGRSGSITYQKTTKGSTSTIRSYAYLNNQIIGWTDTGSAGTESKRYAVTDMLGSVTKVLDETGSVLWSSEYTAFGTVAGTVTDSVAFSGMFTGKDIDAETGLTYHWNRWRSEDGSCFISEDPARDGSNWYGYCRNNPMTYMDPTGLAPYVNGVYDGPYDPDHKTPEVTYGPEYKTQTYSGPQSPTVEVPDVTPSLPNYDGDDSNQKTDLDGSEASNAAIKWHSLNNMLNNLISLKGDTMMQIRDNELTIDSLKGEISKLRIDYIKQQGNMLFSAVEIFGEASLSAVDQSTFQGIAGEFINNINVSSLAEFIVDSSVADPVISKADVQALEIQNRKKIRTLQSENIGNKSFLKSIEMEIKTIKKEMRGYTYE